MNLLEGTKDFFAFVGICLTIPKGLNIVLDLLGKRKQVTSGFPSVKILSSFNRPDLISLKILIKPDKDQKVLRSIGSDTGKLSLDSRKWEKEIDFFMTIIPHSQLIEIDLCYLPKKRNKAVQYVTLNYEDFATCYPFSFQANKSVVLKDRCNTLNL